jgi:hypothetical protein
MVNVPTTKGEPMFVIDLLAIAWESRNAETRKEFRKIEAEQIARFRRSDIAREQRDAKVRAINKKRYNGRSALLF